MSPANVIVMCLIWMFPRIGVPQNGWFIMENLIEMHALGGPPLFLETPISCFSVVSNSDELKLPYKGCQK